MKDRTGEGGAQAEPWGSVLRKAPFSLLVATWFGAGFLRPASGTWGSLLALPAAFLAARFGGAAGLAALAVAATAAGIPAATRVSALRRRGDPSHVVIDEVAGQTVALIPPALFVAGLAPFDLSTKLLAACFFLFRLFDVWKPGPVRELEKLPGGIGIVADDLLAGLFAGLVAVAFLYFLG